MTIEKCQEDLVRSGLRQHVEAVRAAVGRAVGGLLDTGRELVALKAACRHGEWAGAVQAAGVPERTAQRLMRAWREYEERGALANPPSVTALLESAREGKPDTLSDLDVGLGEGMMFDPDPLFEQVDAFERFGEGVRWDEHTPPDEKFKYVCWSLTSEGRTGTSAKEEVRAVVGLYKSALYSFCESYREGTSTQDDCNSVNTLHRVVLVWIERYYAKVREVMKAPEAVTVVFQPGEWSDRALPSGTRRRLVADCITAAMKGA